MSYQATQAGAPQAVSGFQGQMSGSAQVYIYSQADGWIALGSPSNANVTLQSANEATVHSQATVPAATYTKVRLVLEIFGDRFATLVVNADTGSNPEPIDLWRRGLRG